jgi:AraC-like DNA-binding protein
MDPLSDVCSSLNVKEIKTGENHIGGCWRIRVPTSGDMSVGASLKGSSWLSIDEIGHSTLIQEGDCYFVANHHGYRLTSQPEKESADRRASVVSPSEVLTRHVVTQYPGNCVHTMIGARFGFEDRTHCLFDLLPPIIHVRASVEAAPVIRSLLRILADENAAWRLGAMATINDLARILLVQVLRTHIAVKGRARGWLGALVDAKIGGALALMHRDNAKQWTVQELAAAVGMSRSSFALRFKAVVGQAPQEYWLHWRLQRAGAVLRSTNSTVAAVAFACGFESEKSFGKAFKRVMGCPPASYRKAGRLGAAESRIAATSGVGAQDRSYATRLSA